MFTYIVGIKFIQIKKAIDSGDGDCTLNNWYYIEKKQNFNFMQKLANRWRTQQNLAFFMFRAQSEPFIDGTSRLEKYKISWL